MSSLHVGSSGPASGALEAVPTRSIRERIPAPAAAAIGAAATDLVVLPGRFHASSGVGVFFLAVGLAQLIVGVALLRSPSRCVGLTACGLGLGVLACWILTKTAGWSAYAWWSAEDGTIGFTDWICAALQAVSAMLGLAVVLRRPGPASRSAFAKTATIMLLVLVTLLTAAGVGFGTDGFRRVSQPAGRTLRASDGPLTAGSTTSLTYCTPGDARLGMDVTEPPASAHRPAPVAVYVHGGGLIFGNRRTSGLGNVQADHAGALFEPLRRTLTGAGFVVATIDYRLAPLTAWPAQIQDVACAIRFLRAHANQLGIDPNRVGIWGSSAGATMATLLATAPSSAGFDVGQYLDQSSRVQAVVNMFGPPDLEHLSDASPFFRTTVRIGFGSAPEGRRLASPIRYVAPGDPPMLILYGTEDTAVPARQYTDLAKRLAAAHVPVALVAVAGAGHALNTPTQHPTPAELTDRVTAFFGQTLG